MDADGPHLSRASPPLRQAGGTTAGDLESANERRRGFRQVRCAVRTVAAVRTETTAQNARRINTFFPFFVKNGKKVAKEREKTLNVPFSFWLSKKKKEPKKKKKVGLPCGPLDSEAGATYPTRQSRQVQPVREGWRCNPHHGVSPFIRLRMSTTRRACVKGREKFFSGWNVGATVPLGQVGGPKKFFRFPQIFFLFREACGAG